MIMKREEIIVGLQVMVATISVSRIGVVMDVDRLKQRVLLKYLINGNVYERWFKFENISLV